MEDLKAEIAKIKEHNRNQDKQFETFRVDIKKLVEKIELKVDKIITKLMGRPGWLVLGIISSLTTLSGSLIVYIITQ